MAARTSAAPPIAAEEADRLLIPLRQARGLALAVSGGADSVALMRLVASWRARHAPGLSLVVFTVDHGLRPESEEEARQVAIWAAAEGLPHETLVWHGYKPGANVQAVAREARYTLLIGACGRHHLDCLLTAHHLDDQAETFLMRLARGSGVDGLSGMAPETRRGAVRHLRPLLDVPKARLEATLRAEGRDWIEDPSNCSPRFARARLRALMPALAEEGLDARRLAETAGRMGRARAALEAFARDLMAVAASHHPAGCATLRTEALLGAPEDIALRVLARLLSDVGGAVFPPRLERLERLWRELQAPGFAGATLAGCRIDPARDGLAISREWGREGLPTAPLAPGARMLWDNRFSVVNESASTLSVGPLGDARLPAAAGGAADGLKRRVLRTMPVVFAAGEPVAAPLPGWRGREPYGSAVTLRFAAPDDHADPART